MGLPLLAELPMEAAALPYSVTAAAAAGTLLTWLAVLAAAVGVWRFRSASTTSKPQKFAAPSPPPQPPAAPCGLHRSHNAAAAVAPLSSAVGAGVVGSPRKVAVFRFSGVDEEESYCGGAEKETRAAEAAAEEAAEEEEEEETEELKMGDAAGIGEIGAAAWRHRRDLGWYSALDMGALNGSVVRLWDDDKLSAVSPRRRRTALLLRH